MVSGATTILPPTTDVPSTYQQLLEHTTAMLQQQQQQHPGVHGPGFPGFNARGLAPPPPLGAPPTAAGLLSWHQAASNLAVGALPPTLEEVNGEHCLSLFIKNQVLKTEKLKLGVQRK